MSALAVPHEHPVVSKEKPLLQWFRDYPEKPQRPPLTVLTTTRDRRAVLAELNNGDPPPLMLWGEE